MRIMAALLVVGFFCNARIRPVDSRFAEEAEGATTAEHELRRSMPIAVSEGRLTGVSGWSARIKLALAWTVVGVPAAWGVSQVLRKSLDLFR
jgi:hypothetical protein